MAKRNRVRALLTETNRPEVPPPTQTTETVVALPTQRPSISRPSKRARTTPTEQRLVDEDETVLPPSHPPSPQPESSGRATSRWAPKLIFQNQDIQETDSVVSEKDHQLAFNLTKSVSLPKDMEHHNQLNTELKAIRSSTKSMILAIQKNNIAHKRILELRKTTRQAMAEAEAKTAELKQSEQRTAELEAEVTRLTGIVTSVNDDKQRALTEMKNMYLREMAKLEGTKDAKITVLKKKAEGAELKGFKEGEAAYIQQCEAAKDLFFKCGWRGAVEQLGCGTDTEVYNAPQYFIPASLDEYAADLQKQFLEASDDNDEENEPTDTPVDDVPANQSVRAEPVVEDLTIEQPADTELQAETELPTQTVIPFEIGLRVDAELDAEIDDLLS